MSTDPPPVKKYKSLSPGNVSSTSNGRISHTSFLAYLNSMPDDVLLNILRHFSRKPEEEDWVPHVPVESLIGLCGDAGGMGKIMRTHFKMLCVTHTLKALDEIRCLHWKERKGDMLWTGDLKVARRFVLAGGGKSVHTLIVGMYNYYEEEHGKAIVDEFRQNCPNVKSLSVYDGAGVWTARFGGQLEHLDIVLGFQKVDIIPKYCPNLRELSLFCCGNGNPFEKTAEWRELGRKLECLKLRSGIPNEQKLMSIRALFPNLRSVYIYGMDIFNGGIADLLTSYDEQLEYCFLRNMNEAQLKSIVNACKNVLFSVEVSKTYRLVPTLEILRDRIEILKISASEGPDIDKFKNAWTGCVNIKKLDVLRCSIKQAKAIMETPMKRLEKLMIYREMSKEIKDVFSTATCKIERFGA